MRSGGGVLLGVVLVTSLVSVHIIKLIVSEGSVGGTLIVLVGGETDVVDIWQEYVMLYGKEPV